MPLSSSSITWYWSKDGDVLRLGRWPQAWRKVMAAYHWGWLKTSPAGWLVVYQDQLRAQRSVTSIGEFFFFCTPSSHGEAPVYTRPTTYGIILQCLGQLSLPFSTEMYGREKVPVVWRWTSTYGYHQSVSSSHDLRVLSDDWSCADRQLLVNA